MYLDTIAIIGVFLLTGSVLSLSVIRADTATRCRVIALLEASGGTGLVQGMLPSVLDSLVKLYNKGAIEAEDIKRYGAYLNKFQDLKSVFYEVTESVQMSESAVRIGEYFMIGVGIDPLRSYGRLLYDLEYPQRTTLEALVWNRRLAAATRRSNLQQELRELRLFRNEAELTAFVDDVFVAYIHSHLWAVEKKERFGRSNVTSRDYFQNYLRIPCTY